MQWKLLHQRLTYAAQLYMLAWPWSLQLLVTINRCVMQYTQDMDLFILPSLGMKYHWLYELTFPQNPLQFPLSMTQLSRVTTSIIFSSWPTLYEDVCPPWASPKAHHMWPCGFCECSELSPAKPVDHAAKSWRKSRTRFFWKKSWSLAKCGRVQKTPNT